MAVIAVVGAGGSVGRGVMAALARSGAADRIVAVDRRPLRDLPPGVTAHTVDIVCDELDAVLAGVDTVIHLAAPREPSPDEVRTAEVVIDGTGRLLDAAGRAGVHHLVVVTSALVYGAWPNNPIPLTEEHPVRPNPGCALATQLAQAERLVAEWVDDHPGATAAVLRPVAVVADEPGWLARQLGAVPDVPEGAPPVQFLHVDDLVSAVVTACRSDADGPLNVAPDGSIDPEAVRALTGALPARRLTERVARAVASWGWTVPGRDPHQGFLPYLANPWVVANDRLRSLGWAPAWTNEEALVAAHRAPWWEELSPKRRQELALGAAGLVLLVSTVGAAVLVRRLRARRRRAVARPG